MCRSKEDDISKTARDELDTPKNEGAHEDLAQLGVGLHEGQQMITSQLDYFTRLAHAQPGQRAAARNHVAFASELSGTKYDDQGFRGA